MAQSTRLSQRPPEGSDSGPPAGSGDGQRSLAQRQAISFADRDPPYVTSLVRNASATNTSHTTEIDPAEVTAETLLLWGAEDDFQSIEWAEQLHEDIDDTELIGLDNASHWVPEDRPDAYREELNSFLLSAE